MQLLQALWDSTLNRHNTFGFFPGERRLHVVKSFQAIGYDCKVVDDSFFIDNGCLGFVRIPIWHPWYELTEITTVESNIPAITWGASGAREGEWWIWFLAAPEKVEDMCRFVAIQAASAMPSDPEELFFLKPYFELARTVERNLTLVKRGNIAVNIFLCYIIAMGVLHGLGVLGLSAAVMTILCMAGAMMALAFKAVVLSQNEGLLANLCFARTLRHEGLDSLTLALALRETHWPR